MITPLRLQHLITLVKHGHFGRAADALQISQPTLSKSIKGLEAELGVKLLDRNHGAVTPTAFGEHVLERAGALLTSELDLRREISLLANKEIGFLSVAFGPYPSVMSGYRGIARLLARHPEIKVATRVAGWREVVQRVAARDVDIGVAEVSSVHGNEKFSTEPLEPHRGYFFCRPGHPILSQKLITEKALFNFPWAATRMPARIATHMPARLVAAGTIDLASSDFVPAIELDVPMQLPELLAGTDVLAVAGLTMMEEAVRAGRAVALPARPLPVQANYGFIYLSDRTLPPAVLAFMQAVREIEAEITKMEASLEVQFGLA